MDKMRMVQPQWIRLLHKNEKYAGSYDPQRDVIMFVDRGGTITYDLTLLRADAQNKGDDNTLTPQQ